MYKGYLVGITQSVVKHKLSVAASDTPKVYVHESHRIVHRSQSNLRHDTCQGLLCKHLRQMRNRFTCKHSLAQPNQSL